MPLYEYHCEACQLDFEEQVSLAKADSVLCPRCGSPEVTRLASTFASCSAGNAGTPGATCFSGG